MEWSLAIQKDWKSSNALMGVPSWTDMVMSRARQPNIIMGTKQYDTKIDEVRDTEGDNICTHPKRHQNPFTGSKEVVDHHKITCWENEKIGEEVTVEMNEMAE